VLVRRYVLVACLLVAAGLNAGVQEGLAAKKRGDYGAAAREFVPLAQRGDLRAMITLGLLYQEGGEGLPQNYPAAMGWYLRAFDHGDGDAYNNLGVMLRDGLGVEKNRRIAYALFLIVHMRGLGGESTVVRANRNLRREVEELPLPEVAAALCMSEEYVEAYVRARGETKNIPETAASPKNQRLRDKNWWLESEKSQLPNCSPAG
jgi:TPR repeat protein